MYHVVYVVIIFIIHVATTLYIYTYLHMSGWLTLKQTHVSQINVN